MNTFMAFGPGSCGNSSDMDWSEEPVRRWLSIVELTGTSPINSSAARRRLAGLEAFGLPRRLDQKNAGALVQDGLRNVCRALYSVVPHGELRNCTRR